MSFIKNGVGVIIIKNNQVLLAQRKGSHASGEYGSLGGHLEFSETPVECIKREVFEEAGITLKNIEFLCCLNVIKYDRHVINLTFTAEIESGEPQILEPDYFSTMDWYDLDNLPSPLFKPTEIALLALKNRQKYFEVS